MKAAAALSFQHLSRRCRAVGGNNNVSIAAAGRFWNNGGTPPVATQKERQQHFLSSLSGGNMVKQMAKESPHVDVVRYEHKNRKWSLSHVDYYSEALAIGLLENGLQPGDKVLSWLPLHFSESMVLQFSCSKAGFILYHLDPAMAVEDPDLAKEALSAALDISEANVFVSQEAGSDVNYVRLATEVVPALAIFDFNNGFPFVTPDYPHLRLPIHTGFDQEGKLAWFPLKQMVVPSGNLQEFIGGDESVLKGDTPLMGSFTYDSDGVPVGLEPDILTNEQVYQSKMWPTYTAILDKQFHVVEGVGNVW